MTLHDEERDWHMSHSIVRIVKSRRLRRAGYVTWMGRQEMHIEFWCEKSQKQTTGSAKRREDGIISKHILGK